MHWLEQGRTVQQAATGCCLCCSLLLLLLLLFVLWKHMSLLGHWRGWQQAAISSY
jgi:hypothetical protein